MSEPFAPLIAATYAFEPTPEYTPVYTLERQLAEWRAETPPERRAELDAEWTDRDAALEHARVKYGRGSPAYRAAVRAIGYAEPLAGVRS